MLGGRARERRLEVAVAKLGDRVALRADEMVVVALVADAVAASVPEVVERLDELGVDEGVERPVDGRQADRLPAGAQTVVKLLRRQIVRLASQLGEDADTLWRRANALASEELYGGVAFHVGVV